MENQNINRECIRILDENLIKNFLEEEGVLKITNENGKQVYMVVTKEDYISKLNSHLYTPLFYFCNIYIKLAYTYGCLNREQNTPRDTIFTFWYRKLRTNLWIECFQVIPYTDKLFEF